VKITVGLVILSTLAAQVARADNLDEAKAAFADGKVAFERGEYERALAQFQRANLLAPAPSLSYNIGKTYERMGRYRDAVTSFERYLELVGEPKDDEDRKFQEALRKRISEDRNTPDRPASQPPPPEPVPPPQPPPRYQPYYNPYGYQPSVYNMPLIDSRQVRIDTARRKRNNGIVQLVVGATFLALGSGLTADACARSARCTFSSSSQNTLAAGVELAFSIPSLIVGLIVTPVGIVNLAQGQGSLTKAEREPPTTGPSGPTGPRAMMFTLPPVRF
jgi:tetratricopeptide (TPR) repeat protein